MGLRISICTQVSLGLSSAQGSGGERDQEQAPGHEGECGKYLLSVVSVLIRPDMIIILIGALSLEWGGPPRVHAVFCV